MNLSIILTYINLLTLLCLSWSVAHATLHPNHTNDELAELNDYLIALQVMRHSDLRADELFHRWQDMRNASWKIREFTDERNLPIEHPEVIAQVEITIRMRKSLLNDCRLFFRVLTDSLPTVRIHIDEDLHIDWDRPVVSTAVGSRSLVIIEIKSNRNDHSHLNLVGEPDDQILFWSKPLTVTKNHPRYTFVYFAPMEAGPAQSSILVQWRENFIRDFIIDGLGTLPASYNWYNHIPAKSMYDINHTSDPQTEQAPVFDTAAGSIKFRIRDQTTGEPLPVRVEVRDENGNSYWTPLSGPSYAVDREELRRWRTPLWTFQSGPYFYIGGEAELGVETNGKTVRIYRGFEYEPIEMIVPDNGVIEAFPSRWIDMASRGWYSGHTHIHTTDIGLPVQYSKFWPLLTQAEDLGVSSILTLQGERIDHAIYADEYPMGLLRSHSSQDHLIIYGEEYRNNPYGHLALLGLDYLILPLSSGALGEAGGPDYPPNQFVLEEAWSQGATTIGAHFGNYILGNGPITSTWPSLGFELPVNVALGYIHLAEIYGNGNGPQEQVWYKLLNCGFDLPATAGPDWYLKDTPRVYVHLGMTPFSVDTWLEGLRRGRSFITRGPMLFFTVDGSLPGGKLNYAERSRKVRIHASAITPAGSQPVEIVVNGEVVASGTDLDRYIMLEESAWIAARTAGAHSNPVFLTLGGLPRLSAADAGDFIRVTERLEEWVKIKGLFETVDQKNAVLNVLKEGRAVFENIVRSANERND